MNACLRNRALRLGVLALFGAAGAAAQSVRPENLLARPASVVHLAIAGFETAPDADARDAWVPIALEETLAGRLRRTGHLLVIPTIRVQQGRRELTQPAKPVPDWPSVARAMGASHLLTAQVAGTPDELRIRLQLHDLQAATAPRTADVPAGRLFEALDAATTWLIAQLGVPEPTEPVRRLIFGPPCKSPSALECYAKAVAAARREDLREAVYYAGEALGYDPRYRAAILMISQIEMLTTPAARTRAAARLHTLLELSRLTGDECDRIDGELTQGLLLRASGASEPALLRLENALALAFERADAYAQIGVCNSLSDLYIGRQPPPGVPLTDQLRQHFEAESLRHAAAWQALVLEMLHELGDTVGIAPTANKLALLYEKAGDLNRALELHQASLAAAQALGIRRSEATAWMFLGQIHVKREDWPAALGATTRCLAIAEENSKPGVRIALATIYQNMALPAEALGQYEAAYEQLRKGDDLAAQLTCLRGLARLREQAGQKGAAIAALRDAIDIAHALQSPAERLLREQLQKLESSP